MARFLFARCWNKLLLALIFNSLLYLSIDAQDETSSTENNNFESNNNNNNNNGQQENRPGDGQFQNNRPNNPNSFSQQYPIYPPDQYIPIPFPYNPLTNPFSSGSYPRPAELLPQAIQTPPLESTSGGWLFGHGGNYRRPQQQQQQSSGSNNQQQSTENNSYRSAYPASYPIASTTGLLLPFHYLQQHLPHLIPHSPPSLSVTNLIAYHYGTAAGNAYQHKKNQLQAKPNNKSLREQQPTVVVSPISAPDVVGNHPDTGILYNQIDYIYNQRGMRSYPDNFDDGEIKSKELLKAADQNSQNDYSQQQYGKYYSNDFTSNDSMKNRE